MRARSVAVVGTAILMAACASSGGVQTFSSMYITAGEIRESGAQTAYDILANHKEMLVTGSEIGFRGGNNLDSDEPFSLTSQPVGNQRYYTPLLIVDGGWEDVGDVTTILRRIRAEEILFIQIQYADQVPPMDRRPEASGGVIRITTKEGTGDSTI